MPADRHVLPSQAFDRINAALRRVDDVYVCMLISVVSYLLSISWVHSYTLGYSLLSNAAQRILNGDVPYRDFLTLYPPGHHYPVVLLFKALGSSYSTLELYYGLFNALLAVMLYLFGKEIFSSRLWSLFAATLYVAFVQQSMYVFSDRLFYGVLGLYLLWKWRRSLLPEAGGQKLRKLALGMVFGLTLSVSQEVAVFLAISGIGLYAWGLASLSKSTAAQRVRGALFSFALACVGASVVLLPQIYYFWENGAIRDMAYQLFVFPNTTWASKAQLPPSKILSDGLAIGLFSLFPLVFEIVTYITAGVFAVRIYLKQKRLPGEWAAVPLLVLFGALLITIYRVKFERSHFMFGVVPAMLVFLVLLKNQRQILSELFRKNVSRWVLIGVNVLVIAFLVVYGQYDTVRYLSNPSDYRYIDSVRGGVMSQGADRVNDLNSTVSFLLANTTGDDYIFVVPENEHLYFLANRRNPTMYDRILPGMTYPDYEDKVITSLAAKPPKVVVYEGASFAVISPKIHAYLIDRYKKVRDIGDYHLFMPST